MPSRKKSHKKVVAFNERNTNGTKSEIVRKCTLPKQPVDNEIINALRQVLLADQRTSATSQTEQAAEVGEPIFHDKFTLIRSGPPRLSGHRVVCTGDCLYSFGGYSPQDVGSETVVNELWQFCLANSVWKRVSTKGDIPKEVLSSGAVLLDNRILILVGGTDIPFGQALNQHVYSCDLKNIDRTGAVTWERWTVCGDAPPPLYGQAVALHGEYLYHVGGTNGHEYSINVHRLLLREKRWECLYESDNVIESFVLPRYRHEIALYDNRIFVFGGGIPGCVFGFHKLPTFDLMTLEWSYQRTNGCQDPSDVLPMYPNPRQCHTVVQSADREWIVMTGGAGADRKSFDDAWKFHLPTMQWHRYRSTLPKRLHFHSSAIARDGNVYIFGGTINSGDERSNEVYALSIDAPTVIEASA